METEVFIAVGVLPVELLAYHVSVVCAANDQDSSIYILNIILGSVRSISPSI